jgi:hypothetical protein
MGFNWEQVLGATGTDLCDAYDEQASDALYQDHPRSAPSGSPIDLGDKRISLPFDEI